MTVTFESGFSAEGGSVQPYNTVDSVFSATTGWSVGTVGGRAALSAADTVTANWNLAPGNSGGALGATEFYMHSFGLRVSGTLPSAGTVKGGVQIHSSGNLYVGIVGVDATTFNLRLSSTTTGGVNYGTGTTALTVDTWYDIRTLLDNAGNAVTVWIDDTLEIDEAAFAVEPNNAYFLLQGANSTGMTWHFSTGICMRSTEGETERPQRQPGALFLSPASDHDSTTFGNDDVACNDGAGTYTDWDDWASGNHDSTTTMVVECGGNNGIEISTLSTATIDTTLTVHGGCVATASKANASGKSVATYQVLEDITTNTRAEGLAHNLSGTNFQLNRTRFTSPPAGSWSDYVNGTTFNHASATKTLGAGIRSVDTNGANDDHTALCVELFMWNADPPEAPEPAATRRRVGPTLMSPGLFSLAAISLLGGAIAASLCVVRGVLGACRAALYIRGTPAPSLEQASNKYSQEPSHGRTGNGFLGPLPCGCSHDA